MEWGSELTYKRNLFLYNIEWACSLQVYVRLVSTMEQETHIHIILYIRRQQVVAFPPECCGRPAGDRVV